MVQCLGIQALAAIRHTVTSTDKLDAIGTAIGTSVDTTHIVTFMAYANVGHFVLDGTNKADTVIFTKGDESDSAIQVTDNIPLFDIKRMKGTIILRNLAFHLASPNAVLISGADINKKNSNLILDSCLIFGEAGNTTFLTWWGDVNSKVQIYRSFINMRTGGDISLTAGAVDLRNNLFNFAGLISTTSTVLFKLDHNTIVRTQFDANGDHLKSDYKISDNLFAHHSQLNALGVGGDTAYYPMQFASFNENSPSVKRNVAFNTWKGFEPPPGNRFTSDTTNKLIAPIAGKDSGEAWDWYKAYPPVGFDFGLDKSPTPYNVFPGQKSFTGVAPDNRALKLYFKPSSIPRRCLPQTGGAALDSLMNDSLRLLWPGQQGLTLGDHVFFGLDSMTLSPANGPGGNPVLLAYTGSWNQPKQSEPASKPGRFVNAFPSATAFHPAYLCSTPRGSKIAPGAALPPDRLVFDKVDSAGYTSINEYLNPPARDSLRYLNTSYGFTTTAVVSTLPGDSMVFGTAVAHPRDPASIPYRSDKVFWWVKDLDTLLSATQVQDTVYLSTVKDQAKLEAYLVEWLSAKKGKHVFNVPNGTVTVRTAEGFQIDIDSVSYRPDTALFGTPSVGIKIGWAGRSDSDTVLIRMKTGAGMQAFRDSAGSITPFPYQDDSAGYARLRIGKADSGKAFFLGVAYNVAAGKGVDTVINGATLKGLVSSTPGRLVAHPVDAAILGKDSLFFTANFLGGDSLEMINLHVTSDWEMTFPLNGAPGNPAKLEVYSWDGKTWGPQLHDVDPLQGKSVHVRGIPKGARAVVAVERLLPSTEYVTLVPGATAQGALTFHADYADPVNHDIKSFQVELKEVDQFGTVLTRKSEVKLIPGDITIQPDKDNLVTYRLIYYQGDGKTYGREAPVPASSITWVAKNLKIIEATKLEDAWWPLGFPVNTGLAKILKQQPFDRGDTVLDVRNLLVLHTVNGKARYDSIADPDTLNVKYGDAYLLGSTRRYKLEPDSTAAFLPGKEYSLPPAPDSGWRFIACPFPINYLVANVKSSVSMGSFLQLDVTWPVPPAKSRSYSWSVASMLRSFQGYAYFFHKGETLTFDPFAADTAKPAAKPAAAPANLLEARVTSGGEFSRMWLTDSPKEGSIPFLPVPGGGLEMRLGGGEGFLRKNLAKLDAIDETLEIRSPGTMKAAFALIPSGASPAFGRVRLIDVTVGKVYEGGDLQSLQLEKGPQSFRLLAGSQSFVEERTRAALAGAPREILLSQNFPNPVRRFTRILLDWPAAQESNRTAVLEVFDTRGRAVHRLDLGRVAMGRQVLDLDAAGWNPGVYTYRLTVTSGAWSARMQKRMLVAK